VADGTSIGQIASWAADNLADTHHNGSGPLGGYNGDVSAPNQNDLAGGFVATASLTGYITMNAGSAATQSSPATLPAETPSSGPAPNITYTDPSGGLHNIAIYVVYFGPDLTASPNPVAEVITKVTDTTNWSYSISASNVTPGPRVLKAYVVDATTIPDITHFQAASSASVSSPNPTSGPVFFVSTLNLSIAGGTQNVPILVLPHYRP